MTSQIDLQRSSSRSDSLTPAERRRVTAVWVLLFCSSLTWSLGTPEYVVPIPTRVEQLGTAMALAGALYVAYRYNPRFRLEGGWPVAMYALVAVVALCAPLTGTGGIGTAFRAGRFGVALLAMGLIAPAWRRDPWVLANAHARILRTMIGLALVWFAVGLGVNPEGRLISQVPALPPPQIGQFAGVLVGISVVQLVSRAPRLPHTGLWAVCGVVALLLSKTRTPLIAGAIALAVAVLLLGLSHARARRVLAALVLAGPLLFLALMPFVQAYLRRDQSDAVFSTLTGRTSAWAKVHAFPRTGFQQLFGVGYGDKSVDGIPIDNGYLASYHEVGKVGLVVVVTILVVLAARALVEATPANRALAVFLVTFVAIASYTETGIGDMSPYVMHLVLAGAMVATPIALARPAPSAGAPEPRRSTA
jgi:hypothetical protein